MSKAESMESKIYDLMDWAAIEALVYAEEDHPRRILGPRAAGDGVLVQAFFPGAQAAAVRTADGATTPMVMEDEAGFFAVLLPGKKTPAYTYLVTDAAGVEAAYPDPYAYSWSLTEKEELRFASGIWNDAVSKMGAHVTSVNGVAGVSFAVWAPNALRVSLVGDFNHWDGRALPMERTASGMFVLFVPGLAPGALYKYEIKLHTGLVYLKADPYALAAQAEIDGASVIWENGYTWQDASYIAARDKNAKARPMAIYEVEPKSWAAAHLNTAAEQTAGTEQAGEQAASGDAPNDTPLYRAIAADLAAHAKKLGYTHVEFAPLMAGIGSDPWTCGTTGYFAPEAAYGAPEDLQYLVDTLHAAGIGVILDWNPVSFEGNNAGLASFDGTCLYEHLDPRQGIHPVNGQRLFNYGRGEVCSFLKASALYWIGTYHADGLKMSDLSTLVYLDYQRSDGRWVANMYGGNENLAAIDFVRDLNHAVHKAYPGALMIAEERTGYPEVTGDGQESGLGFDYKWNNGCIDDYMKYIQLDPLFRGAHQDDLTFSMIYNYSERFLLALSHELTAAQPLLRQMPGGKEGLKEANLRLSLAYLTAHPGKKLLVSGQDEGAFGPFVQALLRLYKSQPALYEIDDDPEGFEWISNLDWERNLLVFLRKSRHTEETLLVVANFSNVLYDNFLVGVPYPGKYKEIFNSDDAAFGGSGAVNPRVKLSRAVEQDERKDSIKVRVAPLAVSVFRFTEAIERKPVAPEKKKRVSARAAQVKKSEDTGRAAAKAAVS